MTSVMLLHRHGWELIQTTVEASYYIRQQENGTWDVLKRQHIDGYATVIRNDPDEQSAVHTAKNWGGEE
mgnify:CR=1 FL=1